MKPNIAYHQNNQTITIRLKKSITFFKPLLYKLNNQRKNKIHPIKPKLLNDTVQSVKFLEGWEKL